MYYRAGQGSPGSSGTPGTVLDTSGSSRPGPYLGPPESDNPDRKSRTLKSMLFTCFSGHFLTGSFGTPFPSRRFLHFS